MSGNKLQKSLAYSVLFVIGLITLAALSIIPKTKFDYNFERFFPPSDTDLQFYYDHTATFESDNDFLLVGIGNDRSIYNKDFLVKLDSLTHILENIDHVERVVSPSNINNPIIGPFGVAKAAYIHIDNPDLYSSDSSRIESTPGLKGSLFSDDNKKVSLFLKIEGSKNTQQNDKVVADVETTLRNFEFETFHVAGKIKGATYFIDVMKRELIMFMSISFIVLIIFLFISFRSLWGIWVPISIVGITLIWMIAFMTLIHRPINFMTTLLPTILFVVCISNVVHITEKYVDELRKGKSKREGMWIAFKEIGLATFFTAFTTAVGFLSLNTSMIIPIKEFGWITAIGVYVAFFLSFSLLPALLYLLKKPMVRGDHSNDSFWSKRLHRMFQWLLPNRQLVFGIVLATMLLSFGGLYFIEMDNHFIEDYSSSDEMTEDYMFFEDNFSGFRPFELSVWVKDSSKTFTDLEVAQEVAKIERGLEVIYGAGFIISSNTFIKGARRAMNGGRNEEYILPADENEMKLVERNIKRLPRVNLRNYLTDDKQHARINGKVKDPGGKVMREYDQQFKIYMKENINGDLIGYRVTGMPFLVDKTNEFLATNIVMSLAIAFIIIAVIMGLLFQSYRMIIIAILPNLLPLLAIAGMMGLVGINIKISTSIIFAIAFGIAVDDTIHFMSKLRIEMNKGKHILYALKRTYLSTGKAIIVTSLILCSGFSILIASDISSTFYIGLLVSTTLLFAVLSDLFFLPVLVIMFYQNPKKRKRKFFRRKRELVAS
ncbi:MAG: MMPL family transporter [Flavobacteriales bacterium]|nr:MMPL family transporter [Flavobacteriales bacterium]